MFRHSEGLVDYTFLCAKGSEGQHLFVVPALDDVPMGQCFDPECPDRGSFGEPIGKVGSESDLQARRRLQVRPPDA